MLAVLLACAIIGPAQASIINNYNQTETVKADPTPDPGPKIHYTIGREIHVYPASTQPETPTGMEYALFGVPATVLFFILIPVVQRLALRYRLING